MATRNDEYDSRSFDETRASSTSKVESPVLVRAHKPWDIHLQEGIVVFVKRTNSSAHLIDE